MDLKNYPLTVIETFSIYKLIDQFPLVKKLIELPITRRRAGWKQNHPRSRIFVLLAVSSRRVQPDTTMLGCVSKLVYSYVQEKNNGYILAKKGALKVGDKVEIHGHEAVITEKYFLQKINR